MHQPKPKPKPKPNHQGEALLPQPKIRILHKRPLIVHGQRVGIAHGDGHLFGRLVEHLRSTPEHDECQATSGKTAQVLAKKPSRSPAWLHLWLGEKKVNVTESKRSSPLLMLVPSGKRFVNIDQVRSTQGGVKKNHAV